MAIRILSFDFDGCLSNLNYLFSSERDIIESNEALLNKIKLENKIFTQAYTIIGSNRQSLAIEFFNASRSGAQCFPEIKKVSDYLGTTLDTFLLADVYGDLPAGESYARAMDQKNTKEHMDWLFDETKASVLYAQIHKVANEHPNEKIVFDFYDDRKDILYALHAFYNKYPELVPTNVEFSMHQYSGETSTLIGVIKGTGFIDENYRQTVKDLAQQAVQPIHDLFDTVADGMDYPINVALHAKPKCLYNRKALSIPVAPVLKQIPAASDTLNQVSFFKSEKIPQESKTIIQLLQYSK